MDKTDSNDQPDSSKTLQCLSVSPDDSIIFQGFQTSSLYKNFIITLENASTDNGVEVLNLEKGTREEVHFSGDVESLNRCDHCVCRKGENEIILYGGRNGDRKCSDIVILTLSKHSNLDIQVEVVKSKEEPSFKLPENSISTHFFDNKLFVLSEAYPLQPKSQNQLFSFDFTSLKWSKCRVTENLPREVIEHNTVLYYGKIYLFGWRSGNEEDEYLSEFYELDLSSYKLEWKKIASNGSLPRARSKACMVAEDEKIYLFGGKSIKEDSNLCDLFQYDIENDKWTDMKIQSVQCELDLEYPKMTGALYNGTLFIKGLFSGRENEKKYGTAKIKIYDLSREIVALPRAKPCDAYQTTELYDNYMVTIQRHDKNGCTIEVLNLETEKFEEVTITSGEMSQLDREYHCSCRKSKNEIVVYGGSGSKDSFDIVILTLNNKITGFTIDIETKEQRNSIIDAKDCICIHFFDNKLWVLYRDSRGIALAYFNFVFREWSKCDLTGQLDSHSHGSVLYKGKIYLFGNTPSTGEERKKIGIFELDLTIPTGDYQLKFVSTGPAPMKNEGYSMVKSHGKIYIFGGRSETVEPPFFFDLFEYDIESKVWGEIKNHCKFRLQHQTPTGVLYKDTLFVKGQFLNINTSRHSYTVKVKAFDLDKANFKLLKNLTVDPKYSDFTFKIRNKRFPVHKDVLAARSPFFRKFFRDESSSEGSQDLDPSCFKVLLDFIYTNKIDFTKLVYSQLKDLISMANQYSINSLKEKCGIFLSQQLTSLTSDQLKDLFILADLLSVNSLNKECEITLSQQLNQGNFKELAKFIQDKEYPILEEALIEFVIKNGKATKQAGSITGLPHDLYMKIVAKLLEIKLD